MIVVQQRIVAARAREAREPVAEALPCGLRKAIRDNAPDCVEYRFAPPADCPPLAANDTLAAD
jgi:hypothetical protein